MKIKPSYNTVLIKPESVSGLVGGSVIEAVVTGKNQPEVGRVIARGRFHPRWEGEPNPIADEILVNKIVAYRRYGESRFLLAGEEYLFVSFDDILGMIELERSDESKHDQTTSV